MRLKGYLKKFFIFGLILFLGITLLPTGAASVAHAEETREIKLNVYNQTIVKGKSFSLYVYNLTEGQTVAYHSSAPAVASVDANGVVSANLVGTATILVTVSEGDNVVDVLSCNITIGPPAISVQFIKLEIKLEVGDRYTIKRIIQPLISAEAPKFSSYNKKIASVSAGGRVTAKKEGETYIFAQIDNGDFAVCKVIVVPESTPLSEGVQIASPAEPLTGENTLEAPVNSTEAVSVPETAQKVESVDSLLKNLNDMDFETFLEKLNAAGKNTD